MFRTGFGLPTLNTQHSTLPFSAVAIWRAIGYHAAVRIVTADMVRALDRRATEEAGIPGAVLMENAGRAVFEQIRERFTPLRDQLFSVYCGLGNNGGDGFVVARYLSLAGARVRVQVVGDTSRIEGDAATHFRLMQEIGVRPGVGETGPGVKVDALLGTGASGAPRGEFAYTIRRLNADSFPIVSVDIPSGVDATTGRTPGEAVRATVTVTFSYPKLGMFLAPGADCVGELVVSDIGFPWEILKPEHDFTWIRADELRGLLRKRPAEAHKGLFGHVLVLGGSRGMSGAPTMTATAAMRAGAGLVTVAAPESAQPIIAAKLSEAMTIALPDEGGSLAECGFAAFSEAAERADVLCIGPGATQIPTAQQLMIQALREIDKPTVVDADGLNALAGQAESVQQRQSALILTPHPGECARLLGRDTESVQEDRVAAVRETAGRYGAVCVLKGRRTLVADGRSTKDPIPVAINTSGNPGMATGGSGDSLTGIIAALLGQRLDALDAACLGVYLHGRAGDLACNRLGEAGLIAGDIIDSIPDAIRELEGNHVC